MTKTIRVIISVIAALALFSAGTFAWINTTQTKANEFRGDPEDGGGTLHDDFDDPNKDVYIENWGESNLYVRIRLDEYMEVGSGAGLYGGTLLDRLLDPNNHAVSLMQDGSNIYTMTTWNPHIPDVSAETCEAVANFHKFWRWKMGGQKWYIPASSDYRAEIGYVDQNNGQFNSTTPGAQQTLNAQVLTMEAWKALGSPIGSYWVVDADGWAYWAAPLKPGTATGLLLDSVTRINAPSDSYYYAINVIAQMATKYGEGNNYLNFGDDSDSDHTWTDDGRDLLDKIVNGDQSVSGINITASNGTWIGDKLYLPQGQSTDLTASVNVENGASADVNWSHSGSSGFTFSSYGNGAVVQTTPAIAEGSKLTVAAVSAADESRSADLKIIIIDKDAQGVVVGGDGKLYIDYGDNTFREINDEGIIVGDLICGGFDLTPGTGDDRTDIVFTDNGEKLLGPNKNGSYQSAGPDGLLGTEDDEFWWKKPGLEDFDVEDLDFPEDFTKDPPAGLQVRNIVVSPSSASVVKGNSKLFTAIVYLTDNTVDDAGVTWSVMPSSSAGIDSSGNLTVNSDASASSVQVTATSVTDPTVSQSVTVTVKAQIEDTPSAENGRILEPAQSGDTVDWIEIARNGNYSLIVRADYINIHDNNMGNPYMQAFPYGPSTNNYQTSGVRTEINKWFNGTSAADNLIGSARLREFTVTNNAFSVLGSGCSETGGLTNGFSKPTTTKAGTGNDVAFALSFGEAANFISQEYATTFTGGNYATSSTIAAANHNKLVKNGKAYGVWLRSPGTNTGAASAIQDTTGRVFQYLINSSGQGLVYPALWVESAVFDPIF